MSVSASSSISSKISASGRNVIVVPVSSFALADDLHVARRLAALELLAVDLAVAAHLGDQPLGERVHDRDADAVQAARDLVAVAAELAAGVKLRQDDRQRGHALVLHHVDRDARAPVADRDGVVRVERDLDRVVAPRERLVDGVVDDLVDEVMEAARGRSSRCTCPGRSRTGSRPSRTVMSLAV